MKKRSVIPKPPQPSSIKEIAKKNLDLWINYFKGLSPRIILRLPDEKSFDLDLYREKMCELKEIYEKDAVIYDWPTKENVAFLLSYDSSMPGHPAEFLAKNTYLFCYYNIAFSLHHFEWDGDGEENPFCKSWSLKGYSEHALEWNFIAEIIKDRLEEIEKSVPLKIS